MVYDRSYYSNLSISVYMVPQPQLTTKHLPRHRNAQATRKQYVHTSASLFANCYAADMNKQFINELWKKMALLGPAECNN